jgi:nitrite reductase/ring-hydroxylating ferredoxin subunit
MSDEKGLLTRRCFLQEVGLAGACAALLPMLQACETAEVLGDFEPIPAEVEFDLTMAPYDTLSETGKIVALGDLPILLVRDGQGDILALGRYCPHVNNDMAANSPIAGQWIDAERQLRCRFHASNFTEFGALVSGPSPTGIKRYKVEFDAQAKKGTVFPREVITG